MRSLGIENKFACIRGIPIIAQEDAEEVANSILALKGAQNKKQRILKKEGNLRIQIRKVSCNGMINLRSLSGSKEDWTKGPRQVDDRMTDRCERLNRIHCPDCQHEHQVKELKLRNKQGYFSKLKCKDCKEINSTRLWLCDCRQIWPKCLVHQHFVEKKAACSKAARKGVDNHGVDAPLPKRRKINPEVYAVEQNLLMHPAKRIRLNPGSKLAARFPHLTKSQE